MHTITTTPPDPGIVADVSCPRCGSNMRRAARRLGTGWADYHVCVSCREAVGPMRRGRMIH